MCATNRSDGSTMEVANEAHKSETNEIDQNKDRLTAAIGEFGRWHFFLYVALSLPVKMSAGWAQLDIIFLAPKTTFRCVEKNSTEEIVNSTCYSDCMKYEYYSVFDNTIISEWGLICDRAWLANFTQTISMFGVLIGSVVFGFIADRYGRRPALLIASMMQLTTGFVIPFCPDYWSFTVIRFFMGSSTAGIMVTSFVILIEVVGSSKREMINSAYHLPMALGEMIMPLFAYYLRNWDQFRLGVAIPNLVFLLYFFVVPESPKWLISMGEFDKASVVMTKAAKCNNLPAENMIDIAKSIMSESRNTQEEQQIKATYMDLVKIPSLRVKNICSCLVWFILGVNFYGGNQYIGQTSSNVYITVLMAGALQIPGILLGGYFCRCFGRRATVITFFLVSAISNGLLVVPNDHVRLVAGSVAVSCSSGAFTIMYMYSSELFPTVARNMAMGASSTASRIGSMLAPFVASLSVQAVWLPPAIFTIAPLIAAAGCCCLPETKGRRLADYLVDERE